MTVTPYQAHLQEYTGAVTLGDYAHILGIDECGIWGVNNPDAVQVACGSIWSKYERDRLAYFLDEAQKEIEDVLGFFMQRRWVVGALTDQENYDPRYVDQQNYRKSGHMKTKWAVVIAGGVRAVETIASGTALNQATDPGVVGPLATTVTDVNEIAVFHPGTDVRIVSSKITISGGQLSIEIPRCRTVKQAFANNDNTGVAYATLSNFENTVDVKRVYNDPSTNAVLVSPHTCGADCYTNGCTETTQAGCIYVRKGRLGIVDVSPATYSGGAWSSTVSNCCKNYQIVRLNYYAGLIEPTVNMKKTVIKLAHTKMPYELCKCDITQQAWKEDNTVPTALTGQRINCPFGLANGAWEAYSFAKAFRIVKSARGF